MDRRHIGLWRIIPLVNWRQPPYIGHMTDPRSFLYQPGLLDPDSAVAVTRDMLRHSDDGELYLQYAASEAFVFDDGRLKLADYSNDAGFGLRGLSGEMTGFSHASEISEAAIRRAGETLKLLDPATVQWKLTVVRDRYVSPVPLRSSSTA